MLLKWAKQNNLGKSFQELCEDPNVKKYLLQSLIKYGKANNLKGFEIIKNVHLTYKSFSISNNLLTPTLKLKRYQAKIKFHNEIIEMYNEIL
jgi:long-chain acyl-CoA synthetase